jgi:hypothetical protein
MDDLTLTYADRDLILAGLFELTISYAAPSANALAAKLGGNPNEMFFGAEDGR